MAGNGYDNGQGAADPRQGWSAAPGGARGGADGGAGEPGYFTGPPGSPQDRYAAPDRYAAQDTDPYAADRPGSTRAFTVGTGMPYGEQYQEHDGYDAQYPGERPDQYPAQDNVAVYRAGGQSAPHVSGPRLGWKALLTGIYRDPTHTFDRMRDHQVWLPALTVSLVYGVLAVLGMGSTHNDVVDSTFSIALWAIAGTAVAFTLAGAMLGGVTYALARRLGGDGPWQSTVGLAVLIGWTTDVPRLLLALFLPTDNIVVQLLGWASWLFCAVLLTIMVRRLHDLPWGKAAGAAALQLLALLVLIKLPTLG
ncbi:hypothetical protein GCM10009760_43880 [Kitasatospora kazusensis]|uniref:Yip1 domain-containing protein n=1 Tax=Kitasatospora kazusensis TaxID=407974 RepID=A0ABN2ZYN0_9ACTN